MKPTTLPQRFARCLWLLAATALIVPLWVLAGSRSPSTDGTFELAWGSGGYVEGRFYQPRAMAIDAEDRLYIVDKTARVQVFTRDGDYLYGWRTPEHEFGKPTGISIARDGTVMVADTHYFRILFYTPTGQLIAGRTLGGEPEGQPRRFSWVTDIVEDSQGNYYVSEYGEFDRIHKIAPDGSLIVAWGGHGDGPLQFKRPQSLAIDQRDHLWVADACNHRIQVFDVTTDEPRLLQSWGRPGAGPGELSYPYGLLLDGDGYVYVCEFGNHRVQKFTRDGQSIGRWGAEGRQPGELFNPWAIVKDSRQRLHILDTYNNRVQRIRL